MTTHRTIIRWLLAAFSAVIGLTVLASWWFGPSAGAQNNKSVRGEIIDFTIKPPDAVVRAGTTITFTNNGARPHTVTDRGGLFDTNPITR